MKSEFEIAENGTSAEIRQMIQGWHQSYLQLFQSEIAGNKNVDEDLLQQVFERGMNSYCDFKASTHPNCPPEFKELLRKRVEMYINPDSGFPYSIYDFENE